MQKQIPESTLRSAAYVLLNFGHDSNKNTCMRRKKNNCTRKTLGSHIISIIVNLQHKITWTIFNLIQCIYFKLWLYTWNWHLRISHQIMLCERGRPRQIWWPVWKGGLNWHSVGRRARDRRRHLPCEQRELQ